MLHHISWQQYITAIILSSATWYAFIALRYYHKEILQLLKIKPMPKGGMPEVAARPSIHVMGAIRPDEEGTAIESDELIFSEAEPDDLADETRPNGPSDNLLAEAQALVEVYAEADNKPEFLSFLRILIDKYEIYRDQIDLPSILTSLQTFAKGRLPFPLNDADLPLTF